MEENIEGRNAVVEALRAGRPLQKIYLARGIKSGIKKEVEDLARERRVVVQEVGRSRLDQMATTGNHQGVIALAAPRELVNIDDILALARKKGQAPLVLILDGIEDPYNLGALLRSGEAAGVHGVVIPKRRAVGLTAAVARASAGAVEYVNVAQVTNLARALEDLKRAGLWVVGADPQGEQLYTAADLTGPVGLVIGGEGRGIRRLVREKCDLLVRLPMRGRVTSLNASVAGSLMMYEVVRQRAEGDG